MIEDLERFARYVVSFTAVMLVAGGVLVGRYLFPAQPARESPGTTVAQAEVGQARAQLRVDTVTATVTRLVERHRTDTTWRADTVTIRDTVRVAVPVPVLARLDSTVRACSELASSCQAERAAAARVIGAYRDTVRALQPRFRDRVGVYVGYGGTAAPGGTMTHGAQLGVGMRVWP